MSTIYGQVEDGFLSQYDEDPYTKETLYSMFLEGLKLSTLR